jgi:BirA family biotin operon repressor/biotin-[acetyl-CoA-carboxylase] ligase
MAADVQPSFSIPRFQSLLTTAWVGRSFHYLPVVDSTMDVARELVSNGAADGTVVVAEEQRQGRGRLQRRWLSPRGANLYLTILLYPTRERMQRLSIVTPLAVAEGILAATSLECAIKWPNDVQVKGRKLAGILLESDWSGERPSLALVGAGINVNYDPAADPEIAAIATSVMRETGAVHERELVLARCLEAFECWYEASADEARERWRARLTTLGQQVRVRLGDQLEEGLAEDVTDDGSLVLLRADGSRLSLPAGEVSPR